MKSSGQKVMGIDVSLNHGGFVLLENGVLKDFAFVSDRATLGRKEHGMYIKAAKLKDMHQRGLMRLAFWTAYSRVLFAMWKPAFLGIEDYAYGKGQQAHQIGEVGGIMRFKFWCEGVAIRFHDPGSIKMFAADDGGADKSETRLGVQTRWPEATRFSEYEYGQDRRTVEDLCDAYAVAQLVECELMLRAGTLSLDSLRPKQVQVFNRCTKRWPTSILSRDWYQRVTP